MKIVALALVSFLSSPVSFAGDNRSSEGRPTPPVSSPESPKNAGVATENSKPAETPPPDKSKKKYSKPLTAPAPGK